MNESLFLFCLLEKIKTGAFLLERGLLLFAYILLIRKNKLIHFSLNIIDCKGFIKIYLNKIFSSYNSVELHFLLGEKCQTHERAICNKQTDKCVLKSFLFFVIFDIKYLSS